MPCNSEYMNPTTVELETSRVAALLGEVKNGEKINQDHWHGYHPDVYNRHLGKDVRDSMVAELCTLLTAKDPQDIKDNHSLELQVWWRDHQEFDRKRHEFEMQEEQAERDRQEALAKLDEKDRKALNLD